MYQDELEPQDSDMITIEEHSKVSPCIPQDGTYDGTILLSNIQNFECSKGLYDTSICSNCYQYKLFPIDGYFNLFQCPGCNLHLTTRFENTKKLILRS